MPQRGRKLRLVHDEWRNEARSHIPEMILIDAQKGAGFEHRKLNDRSVSIFHPEDLHTINIFLRTAAGVGPVGNRSDHVPRRLVRAAVQEE